MIINLNIQIVKQICNYNDWGKEKKKKKKNHIIDERSFPLYLQNYP